MSKRRQTSPWALAPAVLAALVAHGVLGGVAELTGFFASWRPVTVEHKDIAMRTEAQDATPMDVTLIDPSTIEPVVLDPWAVPRSEEELAEEILDRHEKAAKEEEKNDKGQIVEVAPPPVEQRSEDAEYRAEYDVKVEKETRAYGQDKAGLPGVAAIKSPPAEEKDLFPREASGPTEERPRLAPPGTGESAGGDGGKGMLSMRGEKEFGPNNPGAARGLPFGQDLPETEGAMIPKRGEGGGEGGLVPGRSGPTERPPGGQPGSDGQSGEKKMPDLRPNEEAITQAVGVGGGTIDYLEDIDEGATTLLNTKRFKYATFFNRVKRQVAQNWHPDVAYSLRDPTGQIYGIKNRYTVLKVSLKPDGHVAHILVEQPSGVGFLDDEAVKAFREAQPFPNPPGGLVDAESNLITFRFGFMFEISRAPNFKVFRYSN